MPNFIRAEKLKMNQSSAVTTSTFTNLKAASELVVPRSIPIALPIAYYTN
jgi:hypothetical protein